MPAPPNQQNSSTTMTETQIDISATFKIKIIYNIGEEEFYTVKYKLPGLFRFFWEDLGIVENYMGDQFVDKAKYSSREEALKDIKQYFGKCYCIVNSQTS